MMGVSEAAPFPEEAAVLKAHTPGDDGADDGGVLTDESSSSAMSSAEPRATKQCVLPRMAMLAAVTTALLSGVPNAASHNCVSMDLPSLCSVENVFSAVMADEEHFPSQQQQQHKGHLPEDASPSLLRKVLERYVVSPRNNLESLLTSELAKWVLRDEIQPSDAAQAVDCFSEENLTRVKKFATPVQPSVVLEAGLTLIDQADSLLRDGHEPVPVSDGMAGVYFISDERSSSPVAVFKPSDEEVGCANNPKGYASHEYSGGCAREGVPSGHSAFREVAASILDKDGFVGVPTTCLAECTSKAFSGDNKTKQGSLQRFVPSEGCAEDLGASLFSEIDVQKIAMFDMRLLNVDRHEGNLLVCKSELSAKSRCLTLVPIDHGCCLPTKLQVSSFEWCWMSWPQVKQPVDTGVAAHIASWNPEEDIAMLEEQGIALEESALSHFVVMTILLQMGVAAGLTLRQIAEMVVRDRESDPPSSVERCVLRAKWRTAAKMGLALDNSKNNKNTTTTTTTTIPDRVSSPMSSFHKLFISEVRFSLQSAISAKRASLAPLLRQ